MNKLKKIIEEMSSEELKNLKKDLESGNIERLINKRISQMTQQGVGGMCPVCHSSINDENPEFTLFFGSQNLRQKASFCASDCLEYFIYRLRKSKQGESIGLENKSMLDIRDDEHDDGFE